MAMAHQHRSTLSEVEIGDEMRKIQQREGRVASAAALSPATAVPVPVLFEQAPRDVVGLVFWRTPKGWNCNPSMMHCRGCDFPRACACSLNPSHQPVYWVPPPA